MTGGQDTACSLPAVNSNGSILTELFLGFVHLPDEVDEALTHLGHALFRPVRVLELTYRSRLAVLNTTTIIHSHNRLILICKSEYVLLKS